MAEGCDQRRNVESDDRAGEMEWVNRMVGRIGPRRWHGATVVTVGLLLIVALVTLVGTATPSTSTTTQDVSTTISTVATTEPPLATWLGRDGVESNAIIAENQMPGTASWRIGPYVSPTIVQGFADRTYVADGQSINLYVTSQAPRYQVVAYRMGWYGGTGAREVWQSPVQPGHVQPACTLASNTNMVSCANWSASLTVPITKAFVPGDYLFKLVAGRHAASFVPMTVWDPNSAAAYVIMNRPLVEQGWNTYGGYSFYKGLGGCILDSVSYPPCNRARVVSFDRPYATGSGASDFLVNEFPLVQYAERLGLDVTYITDITLSEHPNILESHRALLTLDHDETWTYSMRMAVAKAMRSGVNIVYFGAAAMVRHARLEPSPLGVDRQEVDYRNGAEDPLNGVASAMQVTANTWNDPPTNWPPTSQIGVSYSGYLSPGVFAPMVVSDSASWVFRGTGLQDGSQIANIIGSDFDRVDTSASTPANIEILAHSPIADGSATVSGGSWGGYSYSDMTYFTTAAQSGVIDTGNNVWIYDLEHCNAVAHCSRAGVQRITGNILHLFGQGPAGLVEPARSNRASIVPAGS